MYIEGVTPQQYTLQVYKMARPGVRIRVSKMGMLKRRLKQQEDGEDHIQDDGMFEGEVFDESSTSEEEDAEFSEQDAPAEEYRPNKKKVMILASRGVNARQRHLLDDLCSLMPHAKKGKPSFHHL
jgi:ribosome biogenesis protein BRX1